MTDILTRATRNRHLGVDIQPTVITGSESVQDLSAGTGRKENNSQRRIRDQIRMLGRSKGLKALLVDDHPIVTEAIATALVSLNIFSDPVSVRSLADAKQTLSESDEFEIIMLDLHLEDTQGVEAMVALREAHPDIPIIIFSGEDDPVTMSSAFEYGVRGFIPKNSSVDVIVNAIRMVASGSSYIPPAAMRMLGFEPPQQTRSEGLTVEKPDLTPRQQQVLQLLLQGMPNKVIASRLDMAEGTVKTHLNTVFRVMGAKNRAQVILKARQLGML